MFKRFSQNNVVYLSCLVRLNKHFRNKQCLFGIKRTRPAELLFCLLNCPICFVTIEHVQPRKPTPTAKTNSSQQNLYYIRACAPLAKNSLRARHKSS